MIKTIKAKEDLVMDHGEQSFTKGKEYSVISESRYLNSNVRVYDDHDDVHTLGSWFTKFEIVEND